MSASFSVREATWDKDHALITSVRYEVFVIEQSVPSELEQDVNDPHLRHVIAFDAENHVIGTGRVSDAGKIGRMAVRKSWRRQGVGSAVLTKLIELASATGCSMVTLSSQISAVPFYQAHGFIAQGNRFLEAGIDHIQMTRHLNNQSAPNR